MTDDMTIDAWMRAYRTAWDSNEPDDIRALFTDDATYRTAPFDAPRAGVDAIVAGWLEDRDEPDDHEFSWSVAGRDGDLVFVEGETAYRANAVAGVGGARTYSNLWVIRFAPDGRAREFTEWYMRQGVAGGEGSLG